MSIESRNYYQFFPRTPQLNSTELEAMLAKAWKKREIAATLLDKNYQGLRVLAQLRLSEGKNFEQLAIALGDKRINLVINLTRLSNIGAIDSQSGQLVCSLFGRQLLEKIDEFANISLVPEKGVKDYSSLADRET